MATTQDGVCQQAQRDAEQNRQRQNMSNAPTALREIYNKVYMQTQNNKK